MYWIAAAICCFFLLLLILARREEAGEVSSLLKPFYRMGRYLYKRLCHRFPRLFASSRVEKDLLCLQPGRPGNVLKEEYYVKKAALALLIVFLGTVFGAAARFSALEERLLGVDGTVERGGYREGSREISLTADYGEQKMDFRIDVEPRRMPGADAEAMFEEFLDKLPGFILGKNESLQNVTGDLILAEKYGDYPISVKWKSSRTDLLSDTGQAASVEKEESVKLILRLQYGDWQKEEEMSVILRPPRITQEEAVYREFEDMLSRSQSQSLEQEKWELPMEWRGEDIRWREEVEDNSLTLWTVALVAAGVVFYFLDRDLHEKVEKRKKNLRREYPEIVHKLVLFAGAGMTIRGAFQKIAGEYEEKCRSRNRQSAAYEEVLYLCRELNSGVSEGLAYEHFGKRTGLQEYIRFCTLLAQNLKRGNSTLMDRLREEADKAAQERLQQSRRLGEEAGTKLLIPMVLMLAVEWIFLFSGGMTVAYMTKLFAAVFLEKNADASLQEKYDTMRRYMSPATVFALGGSALVLFVWGAFPHTLMERAAQWAQSFMGLKEAGHGISYYGFGSLKGGLISIAIGAALYFLFIRKCLIRKGREGASEYRDAWPKRLDLEEMLYRPLMLKILPGIFGGVCGWLDRLCGSVRLLRILSAVCGTVCRMMDSFVDGAVVLLRRTLYRDSPLPRERPEGNVFTEILGRLLNAVQAFGNRTWRRKHPIHRDYVHLTAMKNEQFQETNHIIQRSLSFGLLLVCIGLALTLFYIIWW